MQPERCSQVMSVLLACLALIGCGEGEQTLVPVTGRVVFQGQPVAGGMIVFTPDEAYGSTGPIALARIAADGTYQLQSDGIDGVVPGWHQVSIAPPPRSARQTPGYAPKLLGFPKHFRDPSRSGLRLEVVDTGSNQFDFVVPTHDDVPADGATAQDSNRARR